QSLAEQLRRLGVPLGVLALTRQHCAEVLVTSSRLGVVLTPRPQLDGQRLAEQGLGLGVPALVAQIAGEVVVKSGSLGMVLTPRPQLDGQRLAEQGLGLGVPALVAQIAGEVVVRLRCDSRDRVVPEEGDVTTGPVLLRLLVRSVDQNRPLPKPG